MATCHSSDRVEHGFSRLFCAKSLLRLGRQKRQLLLRVTRGCFPPPTAARKGRKPPAGYVRRDKSKIFHKIRDESNLRFPPPPPYLVDLSVHPGSHDNTVVRHCFRLSLRDQAGGQLPRELDLELDATVLHEVPIKEVPGSLGDAGV